MRSGAHPVSCAAAVATIKVYQEDGLIEHAKKMGAILAHEMERLQSKHPSVGETRSIGLFGLFELVKTARRASRWPPLMRRLASWDPWLSLARFSRQRAFYPGSLEHLFCESAAVY